jgi:signal peptidase I
MNCRNLVIRSVFTAFLLILMASIWNHFAPVPFGGQASYIIVAGASMEPNLHEGDLVIAHEAQDYKIGDVVTYLHPLAGPIIHRIIDRQGDQYIFQGDNNDWMDTYFPTEQEMMGKLWLHVPSAGKFLGRLRTPTLQIALATIIAIGVITTLKRETKDPENPSRKDVKMNKTSPPSFLADGLDGILFTLMALLFASGVLAFVAFSQTKNILTSSESPYEVLGVFDYSASAPPGIYDSSSVQTGDPIYRKLTEEITVHFTFNLSSDELRDVRGTIQFEAELSDPGGWKRKVELHPVADFEGNKAAVEGVLALSELQSMIDVLEDKTGFERHEYTLRIVPKVLADTYFNGREIQIAFKPSLVFLLDELQMFLIASEPGASRLDQLVQSQIDFIEYSEPKVNIIPILGFDLPVPIARWLSGIGLFLSSAGLLWVFFVLRRVSQDSDVSQIAFKYKTVLVDIEAQNFLDGHKCVDVTNFDDFGRFAERIGGTILHEVHNQVHHYYLQEGDLTYHYQGNDTRMKTKGDENNPSLHYEGQEMKSTAYRSRLMEGLSSAGSKLKTELKSRFQKLDDG